MLPDFGRVFKPPTNELERFLRSPIDSEDPDYIGKFVLAYSRLLASIAELESELTQAKTDKMTYQAKMRMKMVGKRVIDPDAVVDDSKNVKKKGGDGYKTFTLTDFDRMMESDEVTLEYNECARNLTRRIGVLKGIVKGFEIKASTIPGEQGRINKLIDTHKKSKGL